MRTKTLKLSTNSNHFLYKINKLFSLLRVSVSAPIAKNIMIDIIDALDIPKSEYTLDKEEFWYDIKYTEIPNVIGLELKEAKKQLKNLNINYSGTGYIIKAISPEPGTIVKENSTIKILLGNWQWRVKYTIYLNNILIFMI